MHVSETDLIEFLVDTGLASKKALLLAREEAGRASLGLERVVLMQGLLTENDLRKAKSYILGVPFVDLRGERFDLSALSLIPEPVSREHNAVAYKRIGNTIEVAFLDLETLPEIKFVENLHHVAITPRLTDPESLKYALVSYQNGMKAEFGDVIQRESRGLSELKKNIDAHSEAELRALADEGRTARVLGSLLSHALLSRATNIHIEPTEKDIKVRYRLGGSLHEAAILPRHIAPRLLLRAKLLSGMNMKNTLPQDGRFVIDTDAGKSAFRVSTTPTAFGEKIMMRVLPESAAGFTLESLGVRGKALETLERALHRKEGLILACGPKASGKSTFLYTALDILDHPEKNIHTVEDPIEYSMPRVHQTEVNAAKGLTLERALRAAVLHDADVVMVSNIRDAETAKIASAAALSGELVLAGIATESAAEGLVLVMGREDGRKLLAAALSVSVGMRVVRKLGPDREKYFLSKDELRTLGQLVSLEKLLISMKAEGIVSSDATWEKIPFWKPRPGKFSRLEFQGHIGLYEVVPATARIRELVMNGATRTSITDEAKASGCPTLLEDGIVKAILGLTTIEEVLRALS
ncbi:MAG: Type pilus assembly protein PilB [Parcubacteria group bacterium]|nr:Type pilus assembly protein PilB [Parcubacteria group bacterium]